MAVQNADQMLPTYAFESDVGDLAREFAGHNETLPFQCAVGPSILWELRGLAITWLFFSVVPFLAKATSACPHESFAKYALWWLIVGAMAVVAVVYCEWRSLKYAIVPIVQTTRRLTVFTFNLSYASWLLATLCLSLIGHTDTVTIALFTAMAQKTDECPAGAVFEKAWSTTTSQSVYGVIPLIANMKFSSVVTAAWALMLLQPVIALLATTPLQTVGLGFLMGNLGYDLPPVDYEVKDASYARGVMKNDLKAGEYTTLYPTIWQRNPKYLELGVGHVSAFSFLAVAGRMASITSSTFDVEKAKALFYLNEKYDIKSGLGAVKRSLEIGFFKVLLIGIFQGGIQLNLQVTLIATTQHLTRSTPWQMFFASAMSCAMSSLTVYSEITRASWAWTVISETKKFKRRSLTDAQGNAIKLLRAHIVFLVIYVALYAFGTVGLLTAVFG